MFGTEVSGLSGNLISPIGFTLQWIIYIIIICAILGGIAWFIYQKKVYFIQIQYYENLGGKRFIEAGRDRARVVRLGLVDGELLWCKGKKMYLPADGLKMGLNKYYFAKSGEDGYWYNITLADLDAKQGILDIEPTDRDMKATAYAIRKNTENRHKGKSSPIEKILLYGTIFLVVVATIVWSYYIHKQNLEFEDRSQAIDIKRLEIESKISEDNKLIIAKLEQIVSTSGIRTAPPG